MAREASKKPARTGSLEFTARRGAEDAIHGPPYAYYLLATDVCNSNENTVCPFCHLLTEGPDGERRRVRYRNCAAKLDGRYPHWVGPFCGTRYSVIFFKLYDRNLEVCLRLCMLQVETLPFAWSFRRAASADEWL